DEKAQRFEAMRPLSPEDLALGQYTAGKMAGEAVPGYRSEPGVAADSDVETFAAARMFIDNWRWAGVPFYVRTGKRLPRRTTEAAVVFREAPVRFFSGPRVAHLKPNTLRIHS